MCRAGHVIKQTARNIVLYSAITIQYYIEFQYVIVSIGVVYIGVDDIIISK